MGRCRGLPTSFILQNICKQISSHESDIYLTEEKSIQKIPPLALRNIAVQYNTEEVFIDIVISNI